MRVLVRCLAVLATVGFPLNLWAQTAASQETSVPGGSLMLASYIALWLLIVAFLVVVSRRQSQVDRDLETLQKRIDDLLGVDEG